MQLDLETLRSGLTCKCPRCGKGSLYPSKLNIQLNKQCPECGLDLSRCDSADGPAVFLIFIFGALLVPLALFVEFTLSPPLWLHAALWGTLALGMTVCALRPVKSYVVALTYKHRPDMFEK